ncbi:DUF262 domain-containing protein [Mycoplasma simbae]|uniref:DUF262 domain-containing protein n=1 Tax=Mycoplasma simbae TaxID=36744 RepID=UPI0004976067|nr:DUF262 domain-containing protein [Mycoplasma simbae]
MKNNFNSITIKHAIDKIKSNEFVLPALQRKFTWKHTQIENLFDSLMRGYPINSFLFWEVNKPNDKTEYKYYKFLSEFKERFGEENKDAQINASDNDFIAVIDGQQRLNGLYIGLKGSYAYKLRHKTWKDSDDNIPVRKLYLNISKINNTDAQSQNKYEFKFLSKSDLGSKYLNDASNFWFEVGKILNITSKSQIDEYIQQNIELLNSSIAIATQILNQLWEIVYEQNTINYFLVNNDSFDTVLDMFIRTNSGGTPLSFSDLLMAVLTDKWDIDLRENISDLISEVAKNTGFIINNDFILKTFLVVGDANVSYKIKNFNKDETIAIFRDNWSKIRDSIVNAFDLFKDLGFDEKMFRSKNAAIPVIYYIYHNDLNNLLTDPKYKDYANKNNIRKWLILSFIKGIFGAHSDSVLTKIRKVLQDNKSKSFPYVTIIDSFKESNKNYDLNDEIINKLILSKYDSADAKCILNLLYSNLSYKAEELHVDHMYPKNIFINKDEFAEAFAAATEEVKDFARDDKNWNTVANLQLLNNRVNNQKKDLDLATWVKNNNITKDELFIDEQTGLEPKDFKTFIENRRENIKKFIKQILKFES